VDILDTDRTSIYVETEKIVPWSRTDLPLPQNALIEQSFEGEIQLLTFLTVQEATDLMIAQVDTNSWMLDTELLRDESGYIGTFTKGTETLSLIIKPTFDEQSRTRIQITIE